MAKHLMLVFSDPKTGREDEYNEWYDSQHLPDVTALEGFVAAKRYRLSDEQRAQLPATQHRYLAIYELEGSLTNSYEALRVGVEDGTVPISDALDRSNVLTMTYTIVD